MCKQRTEQQAKRRAELANELFNSMTDDDMVIETVLRKVRDLKGMTETLSDGFRVSSEQRNRMGEYLGVSVSSAMSVISGELGLIEKMVELGLEDPEAELPDGENIYG